MKKWGKSCPICRHNEEDEDIFEMKYIPDKEYNKLLVFFNFSTV
jgi:hypothetical protein